jgi:hypothetical protein
MKAIAKNLYLHENGHYYALWTANGEDGAPKPRDEKAQ